MPVHPGGAPFDSNADGRSDAVPDALNQVTAAIEQGLEALQANDREGCIAGLQQALDGLGAVPDPRARRDQYARLASMFVRLNAADRGLQAAQEAVELDRALGDRNLEGQDILLCGTAIAALGNLPGAIAAYRQAREMFIEDENWANAASATTNIAIMVGQDDLDEGIGLLEESLTYLERQAFPDTEITTRIALIQALVAANKPTERVFDVADKLFGNFLGQLRPDQRENSVGPLEQALDRHMLQHPELDPAVFRAQKFPMLYG